MAGKNWLTIAPEATFGTVPTIGWTDIPVVDLGQASPIVTVQQADVMRRGQVAPTMDGQRVDTRGGTQTIKPYLATRGMLPLFAAAINEPTITPSGGMNIHRFDLDDESPEATLAVQLGREFGADKLVEARERFFREAETAGRLQHPDIVTIFDAGEAGQAGELAWIAMEYVKGVDLQRFTVPGRLLPVPQALEIVARVAEALSYAHSQGVVHRDIKPANVMVDTEGSSVKVMDFGVARVDDASRTRTGIVLGTPSFMSPEQMSGRRTDGRSDLYSLGVMLFQLLTGTLPFEGGSMAELMRRIVNEPAPDLRALRPELPQALADVVALALEKRPEVRYADGVQMAQDLRAVAAAMLAPAPPQAVQDDAFEKTVTFARIEPRHNSAS